MNIEQQWLDKCTAKGLSPEVLKLFSRVGTFDAECGEVERILEGEPELQNFIANKELYRKAHAAYYMLKDAELGFEPGTIGNYHANTPGEKRRLAIIEDSGGINK